MRWLPSCALTLAAMTSVAPAAGPALTIVLDFEGRHSDRSIDAMKREVEGLMREAPMRVEWRSRTDLAGSPADNLVVFRFKGRCVFEPVGYLYDERGPMAFTYSTAGEVQPFSEVACDKVAATVRSAMWGGDFARGDLLLGRALGRVVAHEMVHMLTRSGNHGREGVARPTLSGAQLIAPGLRLSPGDLERIYTQP